MSSNMTYCLFLSVLVVAVTAQTKAPCQSPRQWEGNVLTAEKSMEYERSSRVSYDEFTKKFRITETVEEGTKRDYYDTLYNYAAGKEYRLDLKTKKCNVTSLTGPFRHFGVPPKANITGESRIGAPGVRGESVVIVKFKGQLTDGTRYFGEATYPDCFPVTSGYYNAQEGLIMHNFRDVNVGIGDQDVFLPPTECKGL